MLKNSLLFSFLLIYTFSLSQDKFNVTIQNSSESKIPYLRKIINLNDKIHAISYAKANKNRKGPIILHTYDSEMKIIEEKQLELPKNSLCNDLIKFNNRVFYTYSIKNKKKRELSFFAKEINSKNDRKDKLLMSIPYTKFDKEMEVSIGHYEEELLLLQRESIFLDNSNLSPNNKFWLLPNKKTNVKNNKLILNFNIIENDLDNLSKFGKEISVENEDSKLVQQIIDNEGNTVFLIRTINNQQNIFRVFSLLFKENKIKELKNVLPSEYLLDARLSFSDDKNLLISGFYSDSKPIGKKLKRRDQRFTGVFYNKIDYKIGSKITSSLVNLSKEQDFDFDEKEYAYNLKDKIYKGTYARKLKNITLRNNGDVLLEIGNYKRGYSSATAVDKVSDPNAGSTSSGHSHDHSHFILLDSLGSLKRIKKIEENFSGITLLYNDKLHLIFKLNTEYGFDKEHTFLTIYDFETDKSDKSILLDRKDFLLFFPYLNTKIKENEIVFFAMTTGFIFGGRRAKSVHLKLKD